MSTGSTVHHTFVANSEVYFRSHDLLISVNNLAYAVNMSEGATIPHES